MCLISIDDSGDMIMTYQLLRGLIDTSLHLTMANTLHLQGHSFKIYKQSAQKFVRRNFSRRHIVDK